jgi:hypothetical protein
VAGVARTGGVALVVGGVVVAGGLAIGVVRFAGGSPAEQGVEGALAAGSLAAAVAAPGLLAILAVLTDRPGLLLPAALVLVPLSMLSFAGVLLPLLIPAWLLFREWARRGTGSDVVVAAAVVALLFVAVWALLFAHEDPRSWTTATGGGSTSDVVTYAESAVSLALVAGALVLGAWAAAMPTPRERAGTP